MRIWFFFFKKIFSFIWKSSLRRSIFGPSGIFQKSRVNFWDFGLRFLWPTQRALLYGSKILFETKNQIHKTVLVLSPISFYMKIWLVQQSTFRLPKEVKFLRTSCWDFLIVNRLLSASTRWCAWTSRLRGLASVWSWCLLSARWATFKAPQFILVRIKKSPLDFSRLTEGRPGAKKETLTPIYDHPSLRKKYNWIGREKFQKNLEFHYRGKVFLSKKLREL